MKESITNQEREISGERGEGCGLERELPAGLQNWS